MSALIAELGVDQEFAKRLDLPLAPAKIGYKGATAMGRPSTGQVVPAVTGAGAAGANDIFLGVFAETIDNSATTTATKAITVDFLKEKCLLWRANDGSIDATKLFNPCYFVDDQTVSATSANRAKAGTVMAIDTVLGVAFEVEGV